MNGTRHLDWDAKRKTFNFRRRVPAELQARIGRKEIWESLATANRAEAERKVAERTVQSDRLFAAARSGHAITDIKPADMTVGVAGMVEGMMADLRATLLSALAGQGAGVIAQRVMERAEMAPVVDSPVVDSYVAETALPATMISADLQRLIQNGLTNVAKAELEQPAPAIKSALLFSAVVAKWKAEAKPTVRTELEADAAFRRFTELVGDLPISRITKQHVVQFKDALVKTPARLNVMPEWRAMTYPDLLAKAEPLGLPTLAVPSITKNLQFVRGILGYAVRNGLIDQNVASGVGVARKGKRTPARDIFTADELARVFSYPPEPTARYWVPLLALYTGARLSEVALLSASDVQQVGSIWSIRITDIDRSIKNANSFRRIPVHPALIGLGFLDLVKSREGRLFREIRSERATEKQAGPFSQWFGRYLDSLGISSPRLVFHTLRHQFAHAGRLISMPEEIREAIAGRDSGNVGRRYGDPEGYPLPVLAEWIGRISFGLDAERASGACEA